MTANLAIFVISLIKHSCHNQLLAITAYFQCILYDSGILRDVYQLLSYVCRVRDVTAIIPCKVIITRWESYKSEVMSTQFVIRRESSGVKQYQSICGNFIFFDSRVLYALFHHAFTTVLFNPFIFVSIFSLINNCLLNCRNWIFLL
jgi:hypothetical protein